MGNFINDNFEEHVICKIISSHPAGILLFDFEITLLENPGLIVTEFLMEKAGQPLEEILKKITKYDFIKYFTQISSVMQHIEKEQICYSIIKMPNCLIYTKGKCIIKNYDTSQGKGYYTSKAKIKDSQVYKYSEGYVSPGIYQ